MKVYFVDEDLGDWFNADVPSVPRIGESVDMEGAERRVADVIYSFPEGEPKIYCVCVAPADEEDAR